MQITLKQTDLETAVKQYVRALGIQSNISEITFSTARKGGFSIEAEIHLEPVQPLNVETPISTAVQAPETSASANDDVFDPVGSAETASEEAEGGTSANTEQPATSPTALFE